jgi:hypothetical protein
MISTGNKVKRNEFRRTFLNWLNKRSNDQSIKAESAYERSISILQKRYGYTREQATSQLEKHYGNAWLG